MTRLPLTILFATTALLAQGPNRCASADAAGRAGDLGSYWPSISADGRFCAFAASATNLVPNDTNGETDVFVKDRVTGAITRSSVASNGNQGNGPSTEPKISADGRYVVFVSRVGFSLFDSNGTWDIYRHDRTTGLTVLVSCSALGITGDDQSGTPSISDDGRYIAFRSDAGNLVPADGNGCRDIFVKDLQTGAVQLASDASPNVGGNLGVGTCAISGDGRYVAFDSWAYNLVPGDTNGMSDVFVRDRSTGTTVRTSVGPNNLQSNGGSEVLGISSSGADVLYRSWASNLVAGDTNNCDDVFVGDRIGAWAERVSIGTGGLQGNGNSMTAGISGNGRWVAFATSATNLIAGEYNPLAVILLRDRQQGSTVRASKSLGGSSPNGWCELPGVDGSGRFVVYATNSGNALAVGTNGQMQIVVADLQPPVPAWFATFGQGCMGVQGVPALDRDPATLPWTGTTLRLQGSQSNGNTLGILCVGFSNTNWNGAPLPRPLDAQGMGSCTLFTAVDLTLPFFTLGNGTWNADLAIPAGAGWLSVQLHMQALLIDPWANALGAAMTNAATLGIGG